MSERLVDTREVQKRLLNMAIIIRDILEKNDMPYFIAVGTLLGSIRHKGFIPWDDDFDFCILDDDYDCAIEVLRKELPKSLFLEDKDSESNFFHGWARVKDLYSRVDHDQLQPDHIYTHQGIAVDLFRAYIVKESEKERFLLKEKLKFLDRKNKVGLLSNEEYCRQSDSIIKQIEITCSQSNTTNDDANIITFPSAYRDNRCYLEDMFPLKKYEFDGHSFMGPNNGEIILSRIYGDYMKLPPLEKRIPHYDKVYFLCD